MNEDKAAPTTPLPQFDPRAEPLTKFTFERDFSVLTPVNGGFLITQSIPNKIMSFSRAFSNLDDLVKFLISEKESFEYDNS